MHGTIKAIAWDFDGVLNRNIVDGRFVWSDTITEDLGIAFEALQDGVFDSNFIHVIAGKIDLLSHVEAWLDKTDYTLSGQALLDYWFAKDDLKDPLSCGLVDRLNERGVKQVIATNNEHRRAAYIETASGFADRVAHVFAAGRIGHAKPDQAFFDHVSSALDLVPEHILLVDDSAANVRAARDLGWQAFHFTDETRLELAPFLGL